MRFTVLIKLFGNFKYSTVCGIFQAFARKKKTFIKRLTNNCVYLIITADMKLITDLGSDQPIYEQIKLQIKEQIVSGELAPNTMLPSIRMLAKELKIGIVTAKRAYDDLTAEGFTVAVAGKGVFVAATDFGKVSAAGEEQLKKQIFTCVRYARANGVDKKTFEKIVQNSWEEK